MLPPRTNSGDLALPAPGIVYRTIKQVFPTCRIFREVPRAAASEESGVDFVNMVIFCTKSDRPLTFRKSTRGDYFESEMREEFLRLEHEVPQSALLSGEGASVLHKNDTGALVALHEKSVLGHWTIMRTVMPAWVWERW